MAWKLKRVSLAWKVKAPKATSPDIPTPQ
jgi:hypothetical protein